MWKCCENNNELHSTNPSNAWKQKTKCGSWNNVRPETKRAFWNRVRPERVRRGRLRRVGKILETRGNFDEVFEIKKSTIFIETKSTKSSQSLPNFFVIESSSKILHNQWFSFQVTKKQVETIPKMTNRTSLKTLSQSNPRKQEVIPKNMCDVKLVKLREIDVKKYVFKRALKEAAIKNTTQNLEDWRMDKIRELNNFITMFWSMLKKILIDAETPIQKR